MKNQLFVLLALLSGIVCFSQDSYKTQVFSFSPMNSSVGTVNGAVIGVWHNTQKMTTHKYVNGLNLELNPVSPFILGFMDPSRMSNDDRKLVHNGLHISTGGFMGNVKQNGLGVSLYNFTNTSNGVAVTVFYNYSEKVNGLNIAVLSNRADIGKGMQIAIGNSAASSFSGVQLGLINKAAVLKGVQVGLFNKTNETKGLQLGFWNRNAKRSLPLVNW